MQHMWQSASACGLDRNILEVNYDKPYHTLVIAEEVAGSVNKVEISAYVNDILIMVQLLIMSKSIKI